MSRAHQDPFFVEHIFLSRKKSVEQHSSLVYKQVSLPGCDHLGQWHGYSREVSVKRHWHQPLVSTQMHCNMRAHGKRESSLNHPGSHPEAQACFLYSPTMGTECLHLSSLLRRPHAGLRALAAHTLLLGSIPSTATLTVLFTDSVKAVLSVYIPSFEPQTQTFPRTQQLICVLATRKPDRRGIITWHVCVLIHHGGVCLQASTSTHRRGVSTKSDEHSGSFSPIIYLQRETMKSLHTALLE